MDSVAIFANTADDIHNTISGIVAFNANGDSSEDIQNWIDTSLSETAGNGAEWYIIALSQYAKLHGLSLDFSSYTKSLLTFLETSSIDDISAERISLALISTGQTEHPFIEHTVNNCIGSKGIMSLIFGLHLLNNGYESITNTPESVIHALLALQLEDGGFAVSGQYGDVDVTAMALTALSQHKAVPAVTESINKGLSFLSDHQYEFGGFSSYGVANAESCAQVLTALSALGLDASTEEAFIKNDHSVIDALLSFKLQDSSFLHRLFDSYYSKMATVQAFYSLISYEMFLSDNGSLFIFSQNPNTDETTPTESSSDSITCTPTPVSTNEQSLNGNISTHTPEETFHNHNNDNKDFIKPLIISILSLIWLTIIILLTVKGKRTAKSYAFPTIIFILLIGLTIFAKISTPDNYYQPDFIPEGETMGCIRFTIDCETITGKTPTNSTAQIPEEKIIFHTEAYPISEGATAFSVLTEICRTSQIQLDYSGSDSSAYVRGINYLYEFDFGSLSGWMYYVNGEAPGVSASEYLLSDGDLLEWKYTCNIGKDINN